MNEPLVKFWQSEAARFEAGVHFNVTRTFAFLGAGLTAMGTVVVGIFATKNVDLVLVIPFILLLLVVVLMTTLQEVLVKALYQYWAERMIGLHLGKEQGPSYVTWEDIGGRIGLQVRTTQVAWAVNALLAFLIMFGCGVYWASNHTLHSVIVALRSNLGLLLLVIVGGTLFLTLAAAVVVATFRMVRAQAALRAALGFSPTGGFLDYVPVAPLAATSAVTASAPASGKRARSASAPSPTRRQRG